MTLIKGITIVVIQKKHYCARAYTHTPSNEISGCESRSWQGVGEARKFAGMASDAYHEEKKGHPIGTKRAKDSLFCDDAELISPQEHGVGAKDPKIQRSCGTARLRCDWRLWLISCIHGAVFACITNSGR